MKPDNTEINIINTLKCCRYLPGSWDKRFARDLSDDLSPLQRWYLYHQGYKYRKQIGNDILELICKNYIECNPKPLSRKESAKVLKNALKGDDLRLL